MIGNQNPIISVPIDAGLILESKNLKKLWLRLSETNMLWSSLCNDENINELNNKISSLDSTFNLMNYLSSALEKKKSLISFHPGSSSFEIFASLNTSANVFNEIKKYINNNSFYIDSMLINSANNIKIISYSKDKVNKHFIAYFQPFLLYSSSEALLHQSISQLQKNTNLLQNKDFNKLYNTISPYSNLHIFSQTKSLSRILQNYFNSEAINQWKNIYANNNWYELDLLSKPNSMIFSGLAIGDLTSTNNDINKSSGLKSINLISSKVNKIIYKTIDNPQEFIKQNSTIDVNIIDKFCSCNSKETLSSILAQELVVIDTDSLNQIVILEKSEHHNISYQLKKLSGNDSLIHIILNNEIKKIANTSFLKLLGLNMPNKDIWYLENDNFIIIASLNSLQQLIFDFNKRERLEIKSNFYTFFDEKMLNYSSKGVYWSSNAILNDLAKNVKKKYSKHIKELKKTTDKFDGVSWQRSITSSGIQYNSIVSSVGQFSNKNSSILWDIALDSIISNPQLLKNHRTKTLEIVVQTKDNYIHLISATGKIKWSKKLDGKIIGKIQQIDIYNNAKWQMVLNTKSKIYVIDINGKNVAKFPVNLKVKATNPVSIFDYENNKDYRFVICAEDKKIYNYNEDAKSVKGWSKFLLNNILESKITHFTIAGKDYLIAVDVKGEIKVLNRRGEIRYKPNNKCNIGINNTSYKLKKSSSIEKTQIYFIDSTSTINIINFDGEKQKILLDSSNKSNKSITKFANMFSNNLFNYLSSNNDNINVYGIDKELSFTESFPFKIDSYFKEIGINNKYLLISDEKNQKILVFDSDFNITSIDMEKGSIKSSAADINKDGLDDIVTVTKKGIIVYSISKL